MSGTGITSRGYLAQEHLNEFELINLNARLYDPVLARFLGIDPYVQAPDFTQSYNRYSYCLNNPFKYTDPSGENPILIAAIIIGAYLGGSSVNGTFNPVKWDYNNWQTYAGIAVGGVAGWAGAAAGAGIAASAVAGGSSSIGAGIAGGMVGGMVSGGINGAGMTAVMGGNFNDIMGNMTKGMVMGGFSGAISGGVGAWIGDFSGVAGSAFKNGVYELGHSALKGAATGLAGGAMMAAMEQDASYLWKGAAMGAALSVGMAGIRITALGTAFIPDSKYGTLEDFGQVYRRGSIFMPKGTGITLGRNVAVKLTGDIGYDKFLLQHETGHLSQINNMGMIKFYGRTLKEYMQYGLGNVYGTSGTLEYAADYYAFSRLGYTAIYYNGKAYFSPMFPFKF
jgi:RHS repeat-associated protein